MGSYECRWVLRYRDSSARSVREERPDLRDPGWRCFGPRPGSKSMMLCRSADLFRSFLRSGGAWLFSFFAVSFLSCLADPFTFATAASFRSAWDDTVRQLIRQVSQQLLLESIQDIDSVSQQYMFSVRKVQQGKQPLPKLSTKGLKAYAAIHAARRNHRGCSD